MGLLDFVLFTEFFHLAVFKFFAIVKYYFAREVVGETALLQYLEYFVHRFSVEWGDIFCDGQLCSFSFTWEVSKVHKVYLKERQEDRRVKWFI